jgi:hypothetical protein
MGDSANNYLVPGTVLGTVGIVVATTDKVPVLLQFAF